MDVLALTSVAAASSNLVYCQLSVASALGELLSSKFVNFSNGTNVLVDFYSDPNDNNGTTTAVTSNIGELFTVSISNCIDYDVGIKSSYQDYVSLEASPSSILYEASFHDIYHLLSDSSLPSLNLSSTPISLFQPEYPTLVRSAKESSIEAKQRDEKLEAVDSTELLVHLESYPASQGDVQIIAAPTIILWTTFTTYLDSALQEAVLSCSSPQSVIYVLYHILILIVLYWVNHYLKILSVASSEFHATPPATPTGHESLMCIAKNLNLLLLMSEEDININLKRSESEEQARGKKLKVSVEEEYYNMIESASEVVSGDHTTWDCDSEAESDSSIDNDSPAKRDGSEVLFSTFLRYEPHRSIVDISNCSTLSPLSPSSNLTGEVANSEWCNNFKLEEIREKRKKEAIRPTVDSVELAFLADWQELSLAVPGRSDYWDNGTTTLLSRETSLCPSRDEDVAAVNSDLRELDQVSVLLLAGGSERIEKCAALVSKYDKNALSPTIRSMQVDVCLSPTGCLDTVPACLTPSEWQSVNDMPRVNRLPLTQRITPLKDRVRERTKSVEKMHRSRANAIECTKFVTSSSCSSVSAAMCKIALENTTDDDFVPLGFYKTNCSSEEIGQGNACEEEDNYHSRHSDISNGDIPSVGDVEYSGEYCLRRKYRAESDGSLTSNIHSLCGEENGIDTENEDGSDGESDSDNDLGHFYSPHINSSNLPVSGVAPESASLGYISSYPSVSISRNKHPNAV